MTGWRVWSGGTADSFQQGEKLPNQETPHFLFDLMFPRKWTPPTVPAGRKRGGCSWSGDTTEREEGVTAIEVTQWLELQDTSVKQEGRGSSNPWNPDLLKEACKIAARLEPRGTASNRIYRDTFVLVKVLHGFYTESRKSRIHVEGKVKR